MAYTTINKQTDYFNTKLYTGNGGNQTITGLDFQPDMVWTKGRTDAASTGNDNHSLTDVVRAAGSYGRPMIHPNLTAAEYDPSSGNEQVKTFTSDGFTLGGNENVNYNGTSYASWNWKAGGTGSANTAGSINSTVSANTTAGFSIVKYTGTGANATVGHGLGAVPKMIIFKNTNSTRDWGVYHAGMNDPDAYLTLNQNYTKEDSYNFSNNTAPTNSLFSVGTLNSNNGSSQEYIAYCFAEKEGYSKFGKYTGNGNANGTFIYTGFKPEFILLKQSGGTTSWMIFDSTRDPTNVANKQIYPDTSDAESSSNTLDILSNGFKFRYTGSNGNVNNGTYIYMAIGQSLVGTNNVPCNAR